MRMHHACRTIAGLFLVSWVAVLVGCSNPAEQLYGAATLGQAVPSPLPSEANTFGYGVSLKRPGFDLAPFFSRFYVARLLKNDQGAVVAKSLLLERGSAATLFVNGEETCTIEVQVPEDVFREPTASWRKPMAELGERAHGYDMASSYLTYTHLKSGEVPLWLQFPPAGMGLGQLIADYGAGKYGFWATLGARKNRPAILPETLRPTNVPEYLAFVDELLTLLPETATASKVEKSDDGSVMVKNTPAGQRRSVRAVYVMAAKYPEAFEGLTRPGFHWQGGEQGLTLDTRNLGERRIRIEMYYSALKQLGTVGRNPGS